MEFEKVRNNPNRWSKHGYGIF